MFYNLPKFQEECGVNISVLILLHNFVWTFLSPELALSVRNGKISEVVLREVLWE